MNKLLCGVGLFLTACAASPEGLLKPDGLIPLPREIKTEEGFFRLTGKTVIASTACGAAAAAYLQEMLQRRGLNLELVYLTEGAKAPADAIVLQCSTNNLGGPRAGTEAYTMRIKERRIAFDAVHASALMRAAPTLLQLLPERLNPESEYDLQQLSISDSPAFEHRGMLMDVCRHFFSVSEVKDYIDLLAYYKMNTLHWHLTEDQGWRIGIDAYPKLTEVGAWRTEADGARYGGFYTKEDLREVVAYASSRHILVVPEIEMPGHALAALSAYPELSCTGGPHEVANDWGVFKDIYCAGNDSVFTFLERVLDEVLEIFPSRYIHIGGDEAPKFRWEQCAKCSNRMRTEKLADTHELQSWFLSRIGSYLESKGRIMVGWDEILEGGLPPGAVVQSWQGMEGGLKAARSGHPAIMSPTSHCYLDYDLNAIDMEQVYHFDPVPDSLSPALRNFILGGECNLWSEHIPDRATLDRQAFPRLIAMSEVLWSYPDNRDYEDFRQRIKAHYPTLKAMGVAYGAETVPFWPKSRVIGDSILLEITVNQEEVALLVRNESGATLQSIQPDAGGAYAYPVPVGGPHLYTVQTILHGDTMTNSTTYSLYHHKAHSAALSFVHSPHPNYSAGGEHALTDGLLGSENFRDGTWQGWSGRNLDVVVDLGNTHTLRTLGLHCHQYNNAWILFPAEVEYTLSEDGKRWSKAYTVKPVAAPSVRGRLNEEFEIRLTEGSKARYVRVLAKNPGPMPDWHEAAGADAWIFISEFRAE